MDPTPTELAAIDSLSGIFEWIGIQDTTPIAPSPGVAGSSGVNLRSAYLGVLGHPRLVWQVVAMPLRSYWKALWELDVVEVHVDESQTRRPLTPNEEG